LGRTSAQSSWQRRGRSYRYLTGCSFYELSVTHVPLRNFSPTRDIFIPPQAHVVDNNNIVPVSKKPLHYVRAYETSPASDICPYASDGALLRNATVTISAAHSDNVAIDVSSVVIKVDNVVVTPTKLIPSGVEYTTTLSDGAHTASLTVKDTSCNPATATWSFTMSVPIDYTPYIFGILVLIIVVAAVVVLTSKHKR
jgi:hypothetical protein